MVAIKNILDKAAEKYAIKAQTAIGRNPKGIVSTQVLGLLCAVADELEKQKEVNKKLVKAVNWLTHEVGDNNTWIGKITKEINTPEDADDNRMCYLNKLNELLGDLQD